ETPASKEAGVSSLRAEKTAGSRTASLQSGRRARRCTQRPGLLTGRGVLLGAKESRRPWERTAAGLLLTDPSDLPSPRGWQRPGGLCEVLPSQLNRHPIKQSAAILRDTPNS